MNRLIQSLTASAAVMLAAAAADAAPTHASRAPCFFISQWQGWKSPSPKVLYLGVNMHDVYRVDLASETPMLNDPAVHLVSEVRGSDSICSALDLRLTVADDTGIMRVPLFPETLTKMTPEEVAAIPRKFRPN
jgi:hypothetical protein